MSVTQEHVMPILTAIVGVAILAVIVSKRSATSEVIRSAGGALGGLLQVAVSPVTGTTSSNAMPTQNYPGPGAAGQGQFTSGGGGGSGVGSTLGGIGGTIAGAYFGGPVGASVGGAAGSQVGGQIIN